MRSLRILAPAAAVAVVIGTLALPTSAAGEQLAEGPISGGPVFSDGTVLWASRDSILGQSGFRLPLPAPGPVDDLEVRGATPTTLAAAKGLVAVRRSVYGCYQARPGEATTSCVESPEVLAGPSGGPLHRVGVPHRCTGFAAREDSLAIAAGSVLLVEPRSDCRVADRPDRVVAIDPRRPAGRRVLAEVFDPVIRAAGDFVVWSERSRRRLTVLNLRGGGVRRLPLGGARVDGFDVQADGTVVAALGGRAIAVYRQGRISRRLAIRAAGPLRVERDRVAGFTRAGFFVRDLRGRPAGLGGEAPSTTFDFDGRKATWLRVRELEPPTRCSDAPAPTPPCSPSPGRQELSLRRAAVAR